MWPATRYSFLTRLADPASSEAWEEFQRVYVPTIYRYARDRGLQEADAFEVVQEVMLVVHQQVAAWRPSQRAGSFRAWLTEVVRRTALSVLRRRRRTGADGNDMAPLEEIAAPDESQAMLDGDERRWRFFKAAAEVETEVEAATWRAFWLTAVEGRTALEAGSELGMKVGAVYTAKCRVLARLRERINATVEAPV